MAVPVVFLGFLGLSFAVLWVITNYGDPKSTGESITIEFRSACLDESRPILSERATQIGMPVKWENDVMHTTLPDIPNAKTHIPNLLITPGSLIIQGDNFKANNDNFEDVAIDLDNAGMPQTLIKLDAPTRAAVKELDDKAELIPTLDEQALTSVLASTVKEEGIFSLHSGDGKTADRMQRAADRAIVLAHGPLPCAVRVQRVVSITKTDN